MPSQRCPLKGDRGRVSEYPDPGGQAIAALSKLSDDNPLKLNRADPAKLLPHRHKHISPRGPGDRGAAAHTKAGAATGAPHARRRCPPRKKRIIGIIQPLAQIAWVAIAQPRFKLCGHGLPPARKRQDKKHCGVRKQRLKISGHNRGASIPFTPKQQEVAYVDYHELFIGIACEP